MPQQCPKLLEKRLKLGMGVTRQAAMQACEEASLAVGLSVVSRGEDSLVCLPTPSQSLMQCLLPIQGLQSSSDSKAGRGVTAEIVPSRTHDGRLAVFIAADRKGKGKLFVDAVRERLRVCGSRAKHGSLAEKKRAAEGQDTVGLTTELHGDSSAYYEVSRLLLVTTEGSVGAYADTFVNDFLRSYAIAQTEERTLEEQGEAKSRQSPVQRFNIAASEICSRASPSLLGSDLRRYRLAVDRYLFARVGECLWSYQTAEHNDADKRFAEKKRLVDGVGDDVLYRALQLSPFHHRCKRPRAEVKCESTAGADEQEVSTTDDDADAQDTTTDGSTVFIETTYGRAVKALSRIECVLSSMLGGAPSEAIDALSLAHCELQTCALEARSGDSDLNSMGDLVPLFAALLLRSSISHPSACAGILRGTLKGMGIDSDQESSVLVGVFDSAVRYVTFSLDTALLASSASHAGPTCEDNSQR